ncbi:MAG: hypothetical protein K9J16_12230 [Melioribacteraceae bacterium]|nr:hypothetical protein [Melioribacteraceae bacterium]MCF8354596.1 hypothetical protein [Melioribacteraceae bacterium]MCF8394948.1 hypothetical protein [Melioribacteraceae bacterium]MCF8420173.1 hypothetical protein [Melioribacteraceae bacterium]
MKKYISAFVCGFGAGVLQIVPVAKSFSCCLIIPVAAYLALFLDQKSTGNYDPIPSGKAVIFGLLTGVYAALFGTALDTIVTLVTKQNDIVAMFPELQKMITEFPLSEQLREDVINLLSAIVDQITSTGFSFFYTVSILINNLIIDTIFGIIGGLIGMQILNNRNKRISEE